MSASPGGRAHDGLTADVSHTQPAGARPVSLFHHHGEADTTVAPGPPVANDSDSSSQAFKDELGNATIASVLARVDYTYFSASDVWQWFKVHERL